MTTTVSHPVHFPHPTATPSDGRPGPSGPIARIVAGSVLLGFLGTLFLALVVLPGATEYVTTGSALIAFAAGWTLLAVLSTRMTSQPQQWAFVPAAAMVIVGVALLLFAPADGALTFMGWIWPVPLLALAAWIAVQARRNLQSRAGRWLLGPVVAFLAIGAVGGGYETVRRSIDHGAYAIPGRSYDVGGHRLHLNCAGTGSPTVVLQNGMGETSSAWEWVTRAVPGDMRVCAYDRAGQGWSDDVARPQDATAIAADLHTLLQRAGEPGPYLLVGHSTGGAYAMTYAARYPTEVAGLVLLDATSPEAFTVLPSFSSTNAALRRLFGVAPSLARLGVGRVVGVILGGSDLPGSAGGETDAFGNSARGMRSQRDELVRLRTSLAQAGALTQLGGKPLAVVTASEGQQPGWSTAQDRLATLSTNSVHRVVPATHSSLLVEKQDSSYSVAAIVDVVRSVRTGAHLAAS